MIEIEKSSGNLFTKKSTPARLLQGAIGQIEDWREWITLNEAGFVRDLVGYAKTLPIYPEKSDNKSFKLRSSESIENGWRNFSGYEYPAIQYSIIAGRWSDMEDAHRRRLAFLNTRENKQYSIYTYDQVARRAYDRPAVWP